jgi:hypothetical protein
VVNPFAIFNKTPIPAPGPPEKQTPRALRAIGDFNSVKGLGRSETEMPHTSPKSAFRGDFPIPPFQQQCGIPPRMVVEIVGVAQTNFVQHEIEGESSRFLILAELVLE